MESLIKASAGLVESDLCKESKLLNTLDEDDLRKNKRFRQRNGYESFYEASDGKRGEIPNGRNKYPRCYEDPGCKEVLRVKGFRNRNSNDFQVGRQVKMELHHKVRSRAVSRGRASGCVNLKRPRLCKKYYLVLNRVEI